MSRIVGNFLFGKRLKNLCTLGILDIRQKKEFASLVILFVDAIFRWFEASF